MPLELVEHGEQVRRRDHDDVRPEVLDELHLTWSCRRAPSLDHLERTCRQTVPNPDETFPAKSQAEISTSQRVRPDVWASPQAGAPRSPSNGGES
jgi:hypothetical protein